MKIADRALRIELRNDDPRAAQIRRIIAFGTGKPEERLWNACTNAHRDLLSVIAKRKEVTQPELEAALSISGIGLRGFTTGLSKIVRRLGVPHPLVSVGKRRAVRRFSLERKFQRFVVRQNHRVRKSRKKTG